MAETTLDSDKPITNEKGYVMISDKTNMSKTHLIKSKKIEEEVEDVQEVTQEIPILPSSQKPSPEQMENIMNLVMQMASAGIILGQGKIDERKLTHISELGQVALSHFAYRGKVDKIRFWDFMYEELLALAVSIGGQRANQIIKIVSAYTGSQQPTFTKKPNWLARNIYKKGWREEAEAQGKTVIE